ncbi:chaperone modulator CbpM [Aestuariirhabdus litorea]|uniref:Chaperone modulatory protein CbpM n=1 Tax=Aestuariirhabdus litorea TaxID=2528527 RepID=A0A3P3VN35_9GAMM|nr:chaperone modulator CbpM [Aestuariirhabdus litorea]RRJ83328.1 chaperone modulatory protein CbpM [Aestuariirhabdus litorea]RWW93488.1 chaperone modulatory protein CbpM [Endozoicomonadaceae bacterium GTF-13]
MGNALIRISSQELCQSEGVERELIIRVVEHGIVHPLEGRAASEWVFDVSSIHWIKKALRLRRDFDIDWIAVALVIDQMRRNEALQRENEAYQRQLSRFLEQG